MPNNADIQQDQVRLIGLHSAEGGNSVPDDLCLKAFFCQIKADQFGDVAVIIDDLNFIF